MSQEKQAPPAPPDEIVWEIVVPTNRFILYDVAKGFGIAFGVMGLFILSILIFSGELEYAGQAFRVLGWIVLGFVALIAFVLFVFFGNRFPMRITVSRKGAMMEMMSRRATVANRISIVLGLLARKPGLAGAGILAETQSAVGYSWEEMRRATYYPRLHTITLLNSWRVVLRMYCTSENYNEVAAAVRDGLAFGEHKRVQKAEIRGNKGTP